MTRHGFFRFMSIPKPKQHESEAQFCIRAHKALMQEIPDWRERNQAVWGAWDEDRGPGVAAKLAETNFPPDRFSTSPGHCYFIEHKNSHLRPTDPSSMTMWEFTT